MGEHTVTLEEVLSLARRLSPVDKIRLVQQIAPEVERTAIGQAVKRKSLLGLCADLGPAPSAEDIDQARREAWMVIYNFWV